MELKRSKWSSVRDRNLEMLSFYEDTLDDLKNLNYKDKASSIAYKEMAREYQLPIAEVKIIVKDTQELNQAIKEREEKKLSLYNQAIALAKDWDEEKMRKLKEEGIDINWRPIIQKRIEDFNACNRVYYTEYKNRIIHFTLALRNVKAFKFLLKEFPSYRLFPEEEEIKDSSSYKEKYFDYIQLSFPNHNEVDEYEKKYADKILVVNDWYRKEKLDELIKENPHKLILRERDFYEIIRPWALNDFLKKCNLIIPKYEIDDSQSFDEYINECKKTQDNLNDNDKRQKEHEKEVESREDKYASAGMLKYLKRQKREQITTLILLAIGLVLIITYIFI